MRGFRSRGAGAAAGSRCAAYMVDINPCEAHAGPPAPEEPSMLSQQPQRGARQSLHDYCSAWECARDI